MSKNIFIGLAWPYGNNSLHLGHVAGLISGDVLARYHRLKGDSVLMVSGTDCFGTPIILEALKQGVEPVDIAKKFHQEFCDNLLEKMNFSYDLYTHTMHEDHAEVVQELFLKLFENDYIYTKEEDGLYSPYLEMFLPDRFVEGTCPKCSFQDARGDQCDECGELLDPLELKDPKVNPKIFKEENASDYQRRLEVRRTEHFYLRLSAMQKALEEHTVKNSANWRPNVKGIVNALFEQGLKDRAITRDVKWGVSIPIEGYEDKKIYVWFDAVTGYLSASRMWAKEQGSKDLWKQWWENKEAVHYYVHGKDNVPFHAIIWAGMLYGEGTLNLPNKIISSEYLLLKGKQFSKSRNWAVTLPDFVASFDGELLRFFLISNGPETSDANFSWEVFAEKVNTELVGTYGNLVNRTLSIVRGRFSEGVDFPRELDKEQQKVVALLKDTFNKVDNLIEEGKIKAAFKAVMEIAEECNRYIDSKAPWNKIKEEDKRDEVGADMAVLLHAIDTLATLFAPFLPLSSEKIKTFLGGHKDDIRWKYEQPKKIYKVYTVDVLYKKVTDEEVSNENNKLKTE